MKVSCRLTCTRVPILINQHAYTYTSILHIQRTFQEQTFFRMPFLTASLSCFKIMFSICLIMLIKLCHFRKARSLNVSEKIAVFSLRSQNILLHFPFKTLMKQLGIEKYGNYITYLLHSSMALKLKSQALKQI